MCVIYHAITDDYKTRGESPESTVTLHKSREDANEYETEHRLDYVE